MQLLVKLLASNFGGQQALRRVADLILGIHPLGLGHHRGERVFQFRHPVTGKRTDEVNLGKFGLRVQVFGQRQQRFFLGLVHLVQNEDLSLGPLGQRLYQRFQFVPPLLDRID